MQGIISELCLEALFRGIDQWVSLSCHVIRGTSIGSLPMHSYFLSFPHKITHDASSLVKTWVRTCLAMRGM